jgi:GLPGLI family protein
MKKQVILSTLLLASCLTLQMKRGQAQDVPSLIIHATTVNTPPDNGDEPGLPSETSTVVYVKGGHIKTESKSDRAHTITIIDKGAKKTTSLTEAGGRKFGYYSIDTAGTVSRADSGQRRRPSTNVQYSDDTKTVAGYTCKKAVTTTTFGNRTITSTIWYTPDFPLKEPIPSGGLRFLLMGFDQSKGIPLAAEATMSNGMTIDYHVTKVEQNANIKDSEFDIPKGYDVKPESERPRGGFGGGGFGGGRFRGDGGPGGPGGGGPGGE